MSAIGQIYYHVLDNNIGEFISYRDWTAAQFFGTNLVAAYGATTVSQVGIQAPPGTIVQLNGKEIMIGRTGMYELDAGILLTSIVFPQPSNYVKLTDETNELLRVNGANISEIEASRKAQIEALGPAPTLPQNPTEGEIETYIAYYNNYNSIQSSYQKLYDKYLAGYNQGIAGVYILDEQNPGDLYNVVIDFIYE